MPFFDQASCLPWQAVSASFLAMPARTYNRLQADCYHTTDLNLKEHIAFLVITVLFLSMNAAMSLTSTNCLLPPANPTTEISPDQILFHSAPQSPPEMLGSLF